MQVSEVIRKYRKEKDITQEEMAKRLGVTAPAVNKWENGNSLPDVSLLSPIARLLNISIDTLLSHEKGLSEEEASRLIEEANNRLKKTESFDSVFQWIKQRLVEYPSSHYLILWMARIFDSHLSMAEIAERDCYDGYILDCYVRALESSDETLRHSAAEALYYFHIKKNNMSRQKNISSIFRRRTQNENESRPSFTVIRATGRCL